MDWTWLWIFIDSCGRARLPLYECTSVFEFGAICLFLVLAVFILALLIHRRTPKGTEAATK